MNERIALARKEKEIAPEMISRKFNGGMVEKNSVADTISDIFMVAFLAIVIFVSIVPLWHVVMSSLSDPKKLIATSGLVVWPVTGESGFNWTGYEYIFTNKDILTGYRNTLLYCICGTGLGFLLNTLGGYVIGRKTMLSGIFAFVLAATVLISGGLIPTYMVVRKLHMTGTPLPQIILGCTNGISILILANAFRGVNESLVEAAQIDGAGHMATLFKIMLPQILALSTVFIWNSIVGQWNSWYNAMIYTPTQREWWPLQLWIKDIYAEMATLLNAANPDWNRYLIQYSLSIGSTVPVLCLFPFFLKYIETTVMIGGVKE